ncbi:MAG: hypothetical protein AAGJ18_20770, partial [Bacteroidota bacterium]
MKPEKRGKVKLKSLFLLTFFMLFGGSCHYLFSQSLLNQVAFYLLVDSSNTISREKIDLYEELFLPLDEKEQRISYDNTYWIRGSFPDSVLFDSIVYLSVGNFDEITLFVGKEVMKNGRTIHPDERVMSAYPYLFPVPSSKKFYVKINNRLFSERPFLQVNVFTEAQAIKVINETNAERYKLNYQLGIMGGVLLIFFIYPFMLYLFDKRKYYLYYGIYVLT